MNATHFCENCGATLAADARFCEACGTLVAPTVQSVPASPSSAAPAVSAERSVEPRSANRGVLVFAIMGVVVILVCIAVGVVGFLFMQNRPSASGVLPVSSPQIAVAPTPIAPGNAPPTTAPPSLSAPGNSRVPPTLAPPTVAPSKPSPIPVTVPSVCWFTLDDLKSLPGVPTDFEQSEGSRDWWDYEDGKITIHGSAAYFIRQGGWINVFCNHYANKPPSNIQLPVGYTRVDGPTIGDGSLAYQKQNYQRVRFIKGNSVVSISFSDTASYVTSENVAKLANSIAGRMPSTVSLKQPPTLPRMVNEGSFAKYFGKFELGREDSNARFIPTTTLAIDDFMRVSVETNDPQQRYSFWIADAKQNVYSAQYGVLGTRIFIPDEPLNSGEYTAHLEIAGVIYARKVFTIK